MSEDKLYCDKCLSTSCYGRQPPYICSKIAVQRITVQIRPVSAKAKSYWEVMQQCEQQQKEAFQDRGEEV
jgi:hypothetical protein